MSGTGPIRRVDWNADGRACVVCVKTAHASYLISKETPKWARGARPAGGILEYDKVKLVRPEQTHHPSAYIGKRGLTRYGYHMQEERGGWQVGLVPSEREGKEWQAGCYTKEVSGKQGDARMNWDWFMLLIHADGRRVAERKEKEGEIKRWSDGSKKTKAR